MAITTQTLDLTLKKERRVRGFSVNTEPDAEPSLSISYGEYLVDPAGVIISKGDIAQLTFVGAQISEILPENNNYGLPSYTGLYVGLRNLFEDQFKQTFSGKFLD
jgi:hypothetical protein